MKKLFFDKRSIWRKASVPAQFTREQWIVLRRVNDKTLEQVGKWLDDVDDDIRDVRNEIPQDDFNGLQNDVEGLERRVSDLERDLDAMEASQ